ncbi:hypothetical protein L596_005499 [Steinernema carpocapsae]|uniref:Nucleoporin Nup133/Nup155-like N-terminal domain-containing protein n=1 Tax=Steinernema carpocapsae TaxID=34508 RepID=A0A4U8UZ73_STECR|nr:hypothetical protein L596_005499 [Steinernema carpocapsae]
MDFTGASTIADGQNALHSAANIVEEFILRDKVYTDPSVKLTRESRCSRTGKVGVSGLATSDYKDFESLLDVKEFTKISTRPIPGDLRNQLKRMRSNCGMGMFPEISRAWMTIDSDLFIWNYEHGEDLAFFDGVPDAAIATALAKVKPGVFSDNVHFLLVVATTVEIVVYAVCFFYQDGRQVPHTDHSNYVEWEMYLIPDAVYNINLDGAVVSGVKTTSDGRIFFTADDSLYELCYDAHSWFKNKCKKINHSKGYTSFLSDFFTKKDMITQLVIDDERHIIYTLSQQRSIRVYDLGVKGNDCKVACEVSADALAYTVSNNANLDANAFNDVIALSIVPVRESHYLNFVLVNSHGVRMFFSCLYQDIDLHYFNSIGNDEFVRISPLSLEESRPKTIRLVHIRMPRDYNAVHLSDDSVYMMCHTSDTTVLLKSASGNVRAATATFMSSSNFMLSNDLCENVETQVIPGLTWSIEKFEEAPTISQQAVPGWLPEMSPPLTVYQHSVKPDRFFFMTSDGVASVDRLRPTDIFRNILASYGSESKQSSSFCAMHGPKNAMTMLLSILCSTDCGDARVKNEAQRAFFVFGGEAQTLASLREGLFNRTTDNWSDYGANNSVITSTPFHGHGGAPANLNFSTASSIFSTNTFGTTKRRPSPLPFSDGPDGEGPNKNIVMSYRHDALYTYFARLLGKIWNMPVCYKKNNFLASKYSSHELMWLTVQLKQFKEAINEYKLIPQTDTGFVSTSAAYGKIEAKLKERKSLLELYNLLTLSCEVLHLLKMVNDHQFHAVTSHLMEHFKAELLTMPFSEIVSKGSSLPGEIIAALIRHYLGDNATTNVISESLRKSCPSIFSMDDATAAEALEILQRLRKICNEAIDLLRHSILKVNLQSVCSVFRRVHMFEELVELALYKAQREDPQKLALKAYELGVGDGDRALAEARSKRKEAYACIIDALNILINPGAAKELGLSPSMAKTHVMAIVRTVMKTKDELANVAVFDWLIDHKMGNMLVDSGSVYVEQYLQQKIQSRDDARYQDVLWRHCEKNGKFMAAAKLLHELAEGIRADVNLKQRISYLSQALMCCRSEESTEKVMQFIQELEDKLEVAMVQQKVRDEMAAIVEPPNSQYSRADITKGILDQKLFSLNELYGEFAEVYTLSISKLIILRCANHNDERIIREVWDEFINKEFRSSSANVEAFVSRLVSLSRDLKGSPLFFPTERIIQSLLIRSFELTLDPSWIFELHKVSIIGLPKILENIYVLYGGRDPFWKDNRKAEEYLCKTVYSIGCQFFTHMRQFQPVARSHIADRLLDVLAAFGHSARIAANIECATLCRSLKAKNWMMLYHRPKIISLLSYLLRLLLVPRGRY